MSEAQPRALKRRGDRYCCVVDCHNSKANTKDREPPVKFYRFPGRWYEKERRQAWTAAVRRVNPDGSEWLPTTATRICSDHFVGNCRSEISSHPSYIPTIFPPVYRKKAANQNREGRRTTGLTGKAIQAADCANEAFQIGDAMQLLRYAAAAAAAAELPKKQRKLQVPPTAASHLDEACQTESLPSGDLAVFFSATNWAEATTQVSHADQSNQDTMTNENWESIYGFQGSDYPQGTESVDGTWSHVVYIQPSIKTSASCGVQEQ
ncbi:uncharacterized protein LOC144094800 isoform X1 [Amblyomma americanum]